MDGIKWEGTGFELDSERYEWKFRICEQIPGWNTGAYNREQFEAYTPKDYKYNMRPVIVKWNDDEKTFPSIVQACAFLGINKKTLSAGLNKNGKYDGDGYSVIFGTGKNYCGKIKCELIRENERYCYETLNKLIDGLLAKGANTNRFRVYKAFRESGKPEVCINGWTIRKVS